MFILLEFGHVKNEVKFQHYHKTIDSPFEQKHMIVSYWNIQDFRTDFIIEIYMHAYKLCISGSSNNRKLRNI